MKQCPKCRSTYTDDGLRFCLTDGTELTPLADEQETLAAGRGRTVREDILPRGSAPINGDGNLQTSRRSVGKILAVIGVLAILLVVALLAAGFLLYFSLNRTNTVENITVNKNTVPTASPTPDAEKQRLQDELANIQRRLDEQQKNANRSVAIPPPATPGSPGTVTARVNSPNDGFLALRERPDADGGLIVKIPQSEVVTLENCNRGKVTIGGRSGRWCLVSWNGYEGYVFDAWLIY